MSLRDSRTEYEEFDAECIAETAMSVLVKIDGDEYWIPKSLLHPEDNEITTMGDTGVLCVVKWFATKEGIE